MALKVILLFVALLGSLQAVHGLSCADQCSQSSCPPLGDCSSGVQLGICGCCLECAKTLNQTCGGLWRMDGECGDGLYCHVEDKNDDGDYDFDATGVCQACDEENLVGGCNLMAGKCYCSKGCSGHGQFRFATSEDCAKLLPTEGEGGGCDMVICPPVPPCPPGMTRLHEDLQPGECCDNSARCVCENCPPKPDCPHGHILTVLDDGTRGGGQLPLGDDSVPACCPTYFCKYQEVSDRTCVYDEVTYKHGESFALDQCQMCTCVAGLLKCNGTDCPSSLSSCSYFQIPENQCCAVCVGCTTRSNDIFLNGESWSEDDCTSCTCVDGETRCIARSCQAECANPVKVAGQCCPMCPHSVPTTTDISVSLCPYIKCPLQCESGLMIDVDGCEICMCKGDNAPVCPGFHCSKVCKFGYKSDSRGCPRCRCKRCQSTDLCPHLCLAYRKDKSGCPTCECEETKTTMIISTASSPMSIPCIEKSVGRVLANEEQWFDGCRQCYCSGGKELCTLISCPALSCTQPIKRPGDCCPFCPESTAAVLKVNISTSCVVDGIHHRSGDTWSLDHCTKCLCHQGRAFCEAQYCPPVLCENPVQMPNACCSVCPGSQTISIDSGRRAFNNCTSIGDRVYHHGDVWQPSECRSCVCRHGQIYCFSRTCPILHCRTVLKKGQCCPVCAAGTDGQQDLNSEVHCMVKGKDKYHHNQEWRESCTKCRCNNGQTVCETLPCTEAAPVCNHCTTTDDRGDGPSTGHDVNDQDMDQRSGHMDAVIAMAILLAVSAIIIVALVVFIVMMRRRRNRPTRHLQRILETRPINNQKDISNRRPKSTNLEFLSDNSRKYENSLQQGKECVHPLMERSKNEYVEC